MFAMVAIDGGHAGAAVAVRGAPELTEVRGRGGRQRTDPEPRDEPGDEQHRHGREEQEQHARDDLEASANRAGGLRPTQSETCPTR